MSDPVFGPQYDPTQVGLLGYSWDLTQADSTPEYALMPPGAVDQFGVAVSTGDVTMLGQQDVQVSADAPGATHTSQWLYAAHLPAVDLSDWDAAYLVIDYTWTPTSTTPNPPGTQFYAMPWSELLASNANNAPAAQPIRYSTIYSNGATSSLLIQPGETDDLAAYIGVPGGDTYVGIDGAADPDYRYTLTIDRCYLQPVRYPPDPPDVRPPLRQRQRSDGLAASGAPRQHQRSTLQTSNRQRAVR